MREIRTIGRRGREITVELGAAPVVAHFDALLGEPGDPGGAEAPGGVAATGPSSGTEVAELA